MGRICGAFSGGRARGLSTFGVLALAVLAPLALAGPVSANNRVANQTGSTSVHGPLRLVVHAPARARRHGQIAVTLAVRGSQHIAGYEAMLLFNPAAVQFSAAIGDGRPLGGVDRPNGEAFGAFSLLPRTHVLGDGQKVRLLLAPQRAGRLQLRLADVRVVAFSGRALPILTPVRTVVVQVGRNRRIIHAPTAALVGPRSNAAGQARDLTSDGTVNDADLNTEVMDWEIARMHGRVCGSRYVPARADANRDGCLDVGDVQTFASAAHKADRRTHASALPGANALLAVPNAPIVVNSAGDGSDASPGNGICATSTGACTLRAAIQEANAEKGPNEIDFDIPGSGVQTIQLSGQLPTISDTSGATTINGYTQPGASPNTDQYADNAQIMVQIEGNGAGGFDALGISSANNVIEGLAFFNLHRSIWMQSSTNAATGNSIQGDFIGTDATGTFGYTSYTLYADGVQVRDGGNGNFIGQPTLAGRNVISGNGQRGLGCFHASNTVVYNNIFGLSPDGTRRLPNVQKATDWNSNCSDNIIGGTGPLQRNIMSGNGDPTVTSGPTVDSSGVEISHGPGNTGNQVIGNCFGTDVTCTSAPPYANNGHYCVRIENTPTNNVVEDNVMAGGPVSCVLITGPGTTGNVVSQNWIGIGPGGQQLGNAGPGVRVGDGAQHNQVGPGNTIAYNQIGVDVLDGPSNGNTVDNTITQNSIFANSGLGIELEPDTTTPGDLGPNRFLAYPVITSASPSAVSGSACASCTVEVFISSGDSSGFGEGETFIGSGTADTSGNFTVSVSGLNSGQQVTATATDPMGDTSQFSANVTVQGGATIPNAPELNSARPGDGSVALQWSPPTSTGGADIINYNIYRGTASGGETLLTQVGNVTNYTDTSAQDGTTYWYRVSAVNSVGEGPKSNEFSASPDPLIVSDGFQRTVAKGFGTADVGGPWSVSSSGQTKVANEGVIYGWTSSGGNVWAWNPTVQNNMEVLSLVRLSATNPVGASYQARVVARAQTANARNGYYARITHTTSGAANWALLRVDNSGGTGTTTLATGTLLSSGAAGTKWWVRLRAQATTVQVRFWQAGTSEPSKWNATATDSYWTSGGTSVGVYAPSGLSSPIPDTGFESVDAVNLGG